MNEISSDTTELLEVAVPAAEFTDELSDEALDRATVGGRGACGSSTSTSNPMCFNTGS